MARTDGASCRWGPLPLLPEGAAGKCGAREGCGFAPPPPLQMVLAAAAAADVAQPASDGARSVRPPARCVATDGSGLTSVRGTSPMLSTLTSM